MEVFESLAAAGEVTAAWREEYGHDQHHILLGYLVLYDSAAFSGSLLSKQVV